MNELRSHPRITYCIVLSVHIASHVLLPRLQITEASGCLPFCRRNLFALPSSIWEYSHISGEWVAVTGLWGLGLLEKQSFFVLSSSSVEKLLLWASSSACEGGAPLSWWTEPLCPRVRPSACEELLTRFWMGLEGTSWEQTHLKTSFHPQGELGLVQFNNCSLHPCSADR